MHPTASQHGCHSLGWKPTELNARRVMPSVMPLASFETICMNKDNWLVAMSDIDGLPAAIRLRADVKSFIASGNHRHYLRVVWEISDPDENGLPSDHEIQRLESFEDHLCRAVEANDDAILTFVITSDGLRQWLFYSKDLEESEHRINQLPQEEERYPIELTAKEDASWSEYDLVAKWFSESEA